MVSELMEGLPQVFRTRIAAMHNSGFAALFGDRRDACERRDVVCLFEPVALRTERTEQPRSKRLAGSGQSAKQLGIRMVVHELIDSLFRIVDRFDEYSGLQNESLDGDRCGFKNGDIRA